MYVIKDASTHINSNTRKDCLRNIDIYLLYRLLFKATYLCWLLGEQNYALKSQKQFVGYDWISHWSDLD